MSVAVSRSLLSPNVLHLCSKRTLPFAGDIGTCTPYEKVVKPPDDGAGCGWGTHAAARGQMLEKSYACMRAAEQSNSLTLPTTPRRLMTA